MSYIPDGFEYYRTPRPVAYRDEWAEPFPGWGMRPNMAGPRTLAVGAADSFGMGTTFGGFVLGMVLGLGAGYLLGSASK